MSHSPRAGRAREVIPATNSRPVRHGGTDGRVTARAPAGTDRPVCLWPRLWVLTGPCACGTIVGTDSEAPAACATQANQLAGHVRASARVDGRTRRPPADAAARRPATVNPRPAGNRHQSESRASRPAAAGKPSVTVKLRRRTLQARGLAGRAGRFWSRRGNKPESQGRCGGPRPRAGGWPSRIAAIRPSRPQQGTA